MYYTDELMSNDIIAESVATMGYALSMVMTLKRDEILALLKTMALIPTARPTADLDVHNSLAIPIAHPTPLPSHVMNSHLHREKVIISPPDMVAGTPEQLAEAQDRMYRYAARYPPPYMFVERAIRPFSPPIADLSYFTFVAQLFRTSEKTHVPVIGCTIRPLTTDLLTIMKQIYPSEPATEMSDGALLHSYLQYGQRTPIFSWTVEDQEICFIYLKASPELRPSRIEFPKWMLDADEHEELFRQILATSYLNVNYPPRLRQRRERG